MPTYTLTDAQKQQLQGYVDQVVNAITAFVPDTVPDPKDVKIAALKDALTAANQAIANAQGADATHDQLLTDAKQIIADAQAL